MDDNISQPSIEAIIRSQDTNWRFCIKLLDMLRRKEISLSDTNIAIYKKVTGVLANETIEESNKKQKEYKKALEWLRTTSQSKPTCM